MTNNTHPKPLWGVMVCGGINILIVVLGITQIISPAAMVIIIGVFSFFSTLILTSFYGGKENFLKGEMRKAITTSILMVYFSILALTLIEPGMTLAVIDTTADGSRTSLLSDLSTIVLVITGYYFGSRTAEELFKTWKD